MPRPYSYKFMKLSVIGTGYVGLVAGVCFAEAGNTVTCVDIDAAKVDSLQNGKLTIFEPGLDHLFERNLRQQRLTFSTDLQTAVRASEVIFLALPTPAGEDGSADLSYVLSAAQDIAKALQQYTLIVIKSTVPVGTADRVYDVMRAHAGVEFDVASNPEFLREGGAVEDFMKPERVVIGTSSERAEKMLRELYRPFVLSGNPVLAMDRRSAELTKYASNVMLALRISFMNEVAALCDNCGANVDDVRLGMGLDSRIGKRFLFSGIGYGGSCFPKDVRALVQSGKEFGAPQQLAEIAHQVNDAQKKVLVQKVLSHFDNDLQGRHFALWGLAFKPGTDDMREAPSLVIIEELLQRGATVCAYDPEAMQTAKVLLGDTISWAQSAYAACENADALLIATEWNSFREPDWATLKQALKNPVVFDGRNIYSPESVREQGFTYYSIGRPVVEEPRA
jgi:UDPglucose 6-dehydrogenase